MNTQGIKIYMKKDGDTQYESIGCIKSIGDLDLGKRSSKEDGCMDKETMGKIIGSLKYGSMTINYGFDPKTDSAGITVLKTAHKSNPAQLQQLKIELPKVVEASASGTTFEIPCYVTERSISFPVDDEMEASFTIEMNGEAVETKEA